MKQENSNIIKTKCLILGSGPAGCSAAVYVARANLNPILICGNQPGGQLVTTTEVENYPGFKSIQGFDLMTNLQDHAISCGTNFVNDEAVSVNFDVYPYIVNCTSNKYEAESVIIATGAKAKWLGLESENYFKGHGVSACATCDGFFFRGKEVAVVGGGNSALTEAEYLTMHASKVYLIHRRDVFRGEAKLMERILSNPKIEIIYNSRVEEVLGEKSEKKVVKSLLLKNNSQEDRRLDVSALFVAIGHTPNTSIFANSKLKLDSDGYIYTEKGSTLTNLPGIFAAGDVQDHVYRQAITSAGTGCMAAIDAQNYLLSK